MSSEETKLIDVQTFCALQGCDNFNTSAITKFCKRDGLATYEQWYYKLKLQFNIGDIVDIKAPRVREVVEEPIIEEEDEIEKETGKAVTEKVDDEVAGKEKETSKSVEVKKKKS